MQGNNSLNTDALLVILDKPNFNNLTEEQQKMILSSYGVSNGEKGVFDKMFGNNSDRIPTYITFILCMTLIVIATVFSLISYFTGKSIDLGLWGTIIPVITLALGYMFGKNNKKD